MRVVHCSRCGTFIQKDELRYIVGVHVTLDIDGFTDLALAAEMAPHLVDNPEPEETLAELFTREMAFMLCQPCRDRFVENPVDRLTSPPDLGFVQ